MAMLMSAPEPFNPDVLSLYYTLDETLGCSPIFIFHGPSTTTNLTVNTSRIQSHVFTTAGSRSFARLTIDPTSRNYAAVAELSDEQQGSETHRGLAFSLFKYFQELDSRIRETFLQRNTTEHRSYDLFSELHAAFLVSRMVRIENPADIASQIKHALRSESLSWLDVEVQASSESSALSSVDRGGIEGNKELAFDDEQTLSLWSDLLGTISTSSFIPSSRLRRAPSRPSSHHRPKVLSAESIAKIYQEVEELSDTETSFIEKLNHLLSCFDQVEKEINKDNQIVGVKPGSFTISTISDALYHIATVNENFSAHVQNLLSDDLREASSSTSEISQHGETPAFIEALATTLHEFVPRFREPYRLYIELSAQFPKWFAETAGKAELALSRAMSRLGEQRLKSWLIEPVQRLPRYSLFVDNIAKLLPTAHPALRQFLKSRDILNDICAMDHDEAENPLVTSRLRELAAGWPDKLRPKGRLISATDAHEIRFASQLLPTFTAYTSHIIVLFTDVLIIFEKSEDHVISARGLLAELDRPKSVESSLLQSAELHDQTYLRLVCASELSRTEFVESGSGQILDITTNNAIPIATGRQVLPPDSYTSRRFRLLGAYEGKAFKWTEEVARARVEHRVPESVRDDQSWSLRSLAPSADGPGLVLSVFTVPPSSKLESSNSPFCHVLLLTENFAQPSQLRKDLWTSNSTICVVKQAPDTYIVRCGSGSSEVAARVVSVGATDVARAIQKLVRRLLLRRGSCFFEGGADTFVSRMSCALQSIEVRPTLQHSNSRLRARPLSPVKALSSFLSSAKLSTHPNQHTPANTVSVTKPVASAPRVLDRKQLSTKSTVITTSNATFEGSFDHLEDTLNTYFVAIDCRAGNIVGKSLRNRVNADEIRVNELYNTLIEDPLQHRAAAEVPVDVLFSAFEKFVQIEWRGRVGPILSPATFTSMQDMFDRSMTSNLQTQFNALLAEIAPQNKRALLGVVKLLYDLLDASGNDGDRGTITATFAEILAPLGKAVECMTLLDRLVDEIDWFTEGHLQLGNKAREQHSRSPSRMQSVTSASISSAGSSLRRKFGLGKLSRENSKVEPESRIGNVWRTLSKKSSNPDYGNSIGGKSSFTPTRSKSIDRGRRNSGGKPPDSRPCSAGSIRPESSSMSEATEHSRGTNSNRLPPPGLQSSSSRRRSSLSDLGTVTALPRPLQPIEDGPLSSLSIHAPKPVPRKAISRTAAYHLYESNNASNKEHIQHSQPSGQSSRGQSTLRRAEPSQQKSRSGGSEKVGRQLDGEAASYATNIGRIREQLTDVKAQTHQGDVITNDENTQQLSKRIDRLETTIRELSEHHASRLEEVRMELQRSLLVSEHQRKKADKLWQETSEENEMLYDRYNSELKRLFSASEEERTQALSQKLDEVTKEASKYRSEVRRLRRKNATMKAEIMSWRSEEKSTEVLRSRDNRANGPHGLKEQESGYVGTRDILRGGRRKDHARCMIDTTNIDGFAWHGPPHRSA